MTSYPDLPGEILHGTHYVFHHPSYLKDKKETIVCIHGIGSSHAHYALFAKFLVGEGYHVLAYDLIGRGYSAPPSSNIYNAEEHVEQLHDLLKNLKLIKPENTSTPPRFNLIGHSMGGAVATFFASKYPQYVKSLVLLSPAGLLKSFKLSLLHSLCCCHNFIHRRFVTSVANNISNLRRRNIAKLKLKAMKANGIYPKAAPIPTSDAKEEAQAVALELDDVVINEDEDLDTLEAKLHTLSQPSSSSSPTDSPGKLWNEEVERTIALMQRINTPETVAEAYWQCLLHFPMLNITPAIEQLVHRKDAPATGKQVIPVFMIWGNQDETIPVSNHLRWEQLLTQKGSLCSWKCALIEGAQHALVIECPHQQDIIESIYLFYEDTLPIINANHNSSTTTSLIVKNE